MRAGLINQAAETIATSRQLVATSRLLIASAKRTRAEAKQRCTRQVGRGLFDLPCPPGPPRPASSNPAPAHRFAAGGDHRMRTIAINRHTVNDGFVRLAVAGEVDMASCEVLATTIRAVITGDHVAELVVDLDRVTFLDSSGIRTLVDGQRLATAHGVAYLVTNPHELVHRVLDITGVLHALTDRT